MLKAQQRLGLAVAGLLSHIGAGRLPPVMPDDCSRSKRDPGARLLQSPADIDVVPRLLISLVKAVDGDERVPTKSHIASRNALGHLVAFQDVHRLARTCCHAACQPTVIGRQVRSAYRRRATALETID